MIEQRYIDLLQELSTKKLIERMRFMLDAGKNHMSTKARDDFARFLDKFK
jgi:hypothetical protein